VSRLRLACYDEIVRVASRLDLYTKAVAVTGLGLLGVAGALVDYWPGDPVLPRVAQLDSRRATPMVQTAFDFAGLTTSSVLRVDWTSTGLRPRAVTAREIRAVETEMSSVASLASVRSIQDEPLLPTLPIRAVELEPAVTQLTAPPEFSASPLLASASAAATSVPTEGFLSGVFKKTSTSMGTSLGKASTSVVGAVRAVGDAVKRAF